MWCQLVGHLAVRLRDVDDLAFLALLIAPHDGLHLDQVDHPAEVGFCPHRDLQGDRIAAEPINDGLHGCVEVGPDPVHLVDEGDAGHAVLVGLAPDGFGLRFNARDGVEDGNGPVEHPQRPLHLDREVDVAGGVDDVDGGIAPFAGGGGGGDGDATLLLLLHPVHDGRAFVDLTHLVGAAGVVEDPLGRRRLARVDVGHDPDVADRLQRNDACHGSRLLVRYQR